MTGRPRRWRAFLLSGLAVAILALAAGLVLKARAEALRLITNPIRTRRIPTETPIDYGMLYENQRVTTPDGLSLVGWYIPTENGAIVLAQHGYKTDRSEMLPAAAMLHRHGYGVLITSTRAHDLSDGTLITFGVNEMKDLGAWYDRARTEAGVNPDDIGMLGNSLGGSLVIEFAAGQPGVKAVVANSAFSSLTDTIETSTRYFTGLPPFPFASLIAFWAEREGGFRIADIDAKRWIGRISPRPVFLMQGGADIVISTDSGQLLYDAAGQPKTLWFDPAVGHTGFDHLRASEYERRVTKFFDEYLLGSTQRTSEARSQPGSQE